MTKSKIDWLMGGDTINPFTGCRHGCSFCYARKMAKRLAAMPGGAKYRRVAENSDGDPFAPAFHMDVLQAEKDRLARTRKPRRVFVGSMGEMCFEGMAHFFDGEHPGPDVIRTQETQKAIARLCTGLPQHTFQILTKRPDLLSHEVEWPSNVHLGVSLSRDEDAHRIDTLLNNRLLWEPRNQPLLWASVEPLLDSRFDPGCLRGLDWVVIGAKTGGRKRVPIFLVQAAQRIVRWYAANKIPCFVKDNMRRADPDFDWPREFPR